MARAAFDPSDARAGTARRLFDLLSEARALWLLMDEEEQAYYYAGTGSDACDLGRDLRDAAMHVRAARG